MERGDQGYQVGSYMFNIVAAELCFAAVFVVVLLVTWPDPPWDALLYGGVVLMLLVPFLFFPFSKTLFLAFDLLFRPRPPTSSFPWMAEAPPSVAPTPWLPMPQRLRRKVLATVSSGRAPSPRSIASTYLR